MIVCMRWIRRLLWPTLGLAIALSVLAAWWLHRPLRLAADTVEWSVEPGVSPREVALGWVQAGVKEPAWALYQWFRWSGQSRQIRAGSYEVTPGTTPIGLLNKMVRGDETMAVVRLIDGWTFAQFRAELARAPALKPATAGLSDAEIMAALGSPGVAAEGQFFPDTYAFSKGATDLTVLKRAHHALRAKLAKAWSARLADAPYRTESELLTLASIVEKETGDPKDRDQIAGVFVNRLRLGMPLQTDPTVIYGLGDSFDGNLRKRDLRADTPFNTYTRSGLPPTPIAMPGWASLLAAAQPRATKALYFVARGDGTSEFSANLADHNRAVDKYQRGR